MQARQFAPGLFPESYDVDAIPASSTYLDPSSRKRWMARLATLFARVLPIDLPKAGDRALEFTVYAETKNHGEGIPYAKPCRTTVSRILNAEEHELRLPLMEGGERRGA